MTTPKQIEAAAKVLQTYMPEGVAEMFARSALKAAEAARPVLDVELPVAISRLYDEIDRLRASHTRLLEALQMVLPLAEAYLKGAPSHPDTAKLETARAAIEAAEGGGCSYPACSCANPCAVMEKHIRGTLEAAEGGGDG